MPISHFYSLNENHNHVINIHLWAFFQQLMHDYYQSNKNTAAEI